MPSSRYFGTADQRTEFTKENEPGQVGLKAGGKATVHVAGAELLQHHF